MTDAIEIIRGLAEDAADCGDGDCGDHDVPILAAVTAAAWYEDGLKMLALDIEQKTAEIAHLNGVILRQHDCDHSDCIDREERLRKIEEAARALCFGKSPVSPEWWQAEAALRAALEASDG